MSIRRLSTFAYKLLAIIAGGLLYGAAQAATVPHSNGQIISAESVDAGDYYLGLDGQPIRFHRKKDVYLKLDSISKARKLKRDQFQAEKAGNNTAQAARVFVAAPAGFSQIANHRWNGLEIVKRNPGLQSMAARASAALDHRETEYAPVFTSESGRGEYLILPDIMISFNSEADVQQYQQAMLERFGMKIKNQMMFSETDFVLAFETGVDDYSKVFSTTRELMALPYIKWAEPNMQVKLQRTDAPNPNDVLYREQWGLENWGDNGALCIADDDEFSPGTGYAADIDANDAWGYMDGLTLVSTPVIAIIDDGVQLDHPDLPIWTNPNPSSGIPGSLNRCVNDFNGCNFGDFYESGGRVYNNSDASTIVPPAPQTSNDTHGTMVAGIAGAIRNNSIGVTGSAYSAEILPIRLDFYDLSGMDCIAIVDALAYAAKYADVISNSWRIDLGDQAEDVDPGPGVTSCASSVSDKLVDIKNANIPVLFAAGNSAAGWRKITIDGLTTGSHTIKLTLHKDDSFFGNTGEDSVWIDNITLPDSNITGGPFFDFDASTSLPVGMDVFSGANTTVTASGLVIDYTACTGANVEADTVTGSSEHMHEGSGNAIKLSTADGDCAYLNINATFSTAGSLSFWAWVSIEPWRLIDSPQLIGDPFRVYIDGVKTSVDLINEVEDGVDRSHDALSEHTIYYNELEFPASDSNVIAVGASNDGSDSFDATGNRREDRAYFSQYSSNLNVVAPGINIRTTAVGGGYSYLSGTSASTPMVAGVIANMLAIDSGLSHTVIKDHLHNGADKIGPQVGEFAYDNTTGFNNYYGYGRVNAYKSAQLADPLHVGSPAEAPELCTDPNPGADDDDWLLLTMPAILAAALKNK